VLGQRVVTAIVLLALLLAAVFAPASWPFAVLTMLMIGAAGWEWARLNAGKGAGAVVLGAGLALVCGLALQRGWTHEAPALAWWAATVVWVLGGTFALRMGVGGWPHLPGALRWMIGALGLWTAWLALSHAKVLGVDFLLSVFCLVWMADIAAYFGGRAFGKRKLAPAISPGKSWEGVWSGMIGVLVLAAVWLTVESHFAVDSPSLYERLRRSVGVTGMVLSLLFLAAMSVVGDLVESLVKRAAGAKDSSALLPGHGGVLDRIDALLPVFPLALALVSL
jgi:phosphatidate cytidylyltransferase